MIFKALVSAEAIDSQHTKCTFKKMNNTTFERQLRVSLAQIENWASGTPIQMAMPELNPMQREYFITGFDEKEWHIVFGEQ